ncbi:hypothetical protein Glove_362g40 [Diversispora epigaea]|uniref:Uncharacterized protein n=1 Tax=Diversispora epigaea TaxID=1348612 RepID=A0A397HDK7_9GLOM|nr:hypothetical protein Glove_362g40 [Diversispora epigaea]
MLSDNLTSKKPFVDKEEIKKHSRLVQSSYVIVHPTFKKTHLRQVWLEIFVNRHKIEKKTGRQRNKQKNMQKISTDRQVYLQIGKSLVLPARIISTLELFSRVNEQFSTIINEEHVAEISSWIDFQLFSSRK